MLLLEAPPPAMYSRADRRSAPGAHASSPAEQAMLALALITTWAARTGRNLRDVPVDELTAEELEEFWADDQLEPQYVGPAHHRRSS
jgi:hypothetical protein